MNETRVIWTTIQQGRAQYRVNEAGNWQVKRFGWFPTGHNPRWEWGHTDTNSVPEEAAAVARAHLRRKA